METDFHKPFYIRYLINSFTDFYKKTDHVFFAAIILLYLFFVFHVPLQSELSPDSQLYIGLGQNILGGKGYFDTIRNDEILPSIGFPLVVAVSQWIGFPPEMFTICMFGLSSCILALAVRIWTNSNFSVLLSLLMYQKLIEENEWLIMGVELAIIFCTSLIILFLAYAVRTGYKYTYMILLGFAVGMSILVRPLLLYPALFAFGLVLITMVCFLIRKRPFFFCPFILRIFTTLGVIAGVVFITGLSSNAMYGDSRFLTGTYGAITLFCANNPYLPPATYYSSTDWDLVQADQRAAAFQALSNPDGWEARHNRLIAEIKDYMLTDPSRAFKGWLWRFREFLGFPLFPITLYGTLLVISLFLVIYRVRNNLIQREASLGQLMFSPGIVVSLVFLYLCAFQAMFVVVDHRYRYQSFPWLISICFILTSELAGYPTPVLNIFVQKANRFLRKICLKTDEL